MLCGHFHEPGNTIDAISSSVELQAGSLYKSREYHNGYSICEFYPDLSEDNVKLLLRVYSDNEGKFFLRQIIFHIKNAENGKNRIYIKKSRNSFFE